MSQLLHVYHSVFNCLFVCPPPLSVLFHFESCLSRGLSRGGGKRQKETWETSNLNEATTYSTSIGPTLHLVLFCGVWVRMSLPGRRIVVRGRGGWWGSVCVWGGDLHILFTSTVTDLGRRKGRDESSVPINKAVLIQEFWCRSSQKRSAFQTREGRESRHASSDSSHRRSSTRKQSRLVTR